MRLRAQVFDRSAENASVEPAFRLSYCRIGEATSSTMVRQRPIRAATEPRARGAGSTQGPGCNLQPDR